MSYDAMGPQTLDYEICVYDGSRLQFRGPRANLDVPYVAFLGATETFGKFIAEPFPSLLSGHLPAEAVNLGMINGGIDAYLNDPAILEVARRAELRVVQVMGALNLSNHYFTVHPRRNDRFIAPREALTALFPEVDFARFHFTKAMLGALQRCSQERYRLVCRELQDIWLARMSMLLRLLGKGTVLMWFAEYAPPADAACAPGDPMLVDKGMVMRARKNACTYVEVVPSHSALSAGTHGMMFRDMEAPVARLLMGPAAHKEAALALQEPCAHFLK